MSPTCWLPEGSRLPDRSSTRPRAALFLDRDGVLVEDVHFLRSLDHVQIIGETVHALRSLQESYLLIVASNQSGVGRGYFDIATLDEINRAVVAHLAEAGRAAGAHPFLLPLDSRADAWARLTTLLACEAERTN